MPINNASTPIDFSQLAHCPVGSLWMAKLQQVDERYVYRLYPYHNIRFSTWLVKQTDIIDLTPVFTQYGTRVWKTLIDTFIQGTIYPIENGYVFALDMNSARVGFEHEIKTRVIFVNGFDGRLTQIRDMRNILVDPVMQQVHKLQMPIPYEKLVELSGLTSSNGSSDGNAVIPNQATGLNIKLPVDSI